MATLTKQALMASLDRKAEKVKLSGNREVWVRPVPEVVRCRRVAQLGELDKDGKLDRAEMLSRDRAYSIIDQIMVDDKTPMFEDSDFDELVSKPSSSIDELVDAIKAFNGGSEGNDSAGSNGSAKS